ncbi:Polyketide cyclase / dehydrase and lipid transport [Mycobacteroides salmoniphilum]|nr:Polyketide cyclase / dehydrase and lipid transport [Mycobacteroides salmoniphilum]
MGAVHHYFDALPSEPMTTQQRVHITHEFKSDPQTVFNKLAEHENLGPVFGANVTRVSDGTSTRNGAGSVRRLKVGPLPAFEETTTTAQPNTLIEYKITKGSPLRGHWGRQELTPTASGGTTLDYTIGFDSAIPGLAVLVGKVLTSTIAKGLPKLAD